MKDKDESFEKIRLLFQNELLSEKSGNTAGLSEQADQTERTVGQEILGF